MKRIKNIDHGITWIQDHFSKKVANNRQKVNVDQIREDITIGILVKKELLDR